MKTGYPAQPETSAARSKKALGSLAGDAKTQVQGKLDQATGAVQDLYGQIADAAPEAAAGFEKWIRTTIEPCLKSQRQAPSAVRIFQRAQMHRLPKDP